MVAPVPPRRVNATSLDVGVCTHDAVNEAISKYTYGTRRGDERRR